MNNNLLPQHKGRVPDYSGENKEELQRMMDYLKDQGVLSRAEDVQQPIEYVHPSFLVKKRSGGYRLVTSFGQMAEFARPQPTINTNVEHALHQIGQFEHLIITDLKDSYFQIPLNPESAKYLGVIAPYTGTYVYRRSVMGLPGSEAALEELLSRIFGDLIRAGKMVKVADDLFLGSLSINDLAATWKEVLHRLKLNGLKLSPTKTRINPESATILGWEWSRGSLRPGKHRLNALANCDPPKSVKALRSFIGCYKFMSRVLPCYAEILKPLEEICAGRESADKIQWTEEMISSFDQAKTHLKKAKPIALPKRDEQLNIITDASNTGIAAAQYVIRNQKLVLTGYFNAALRPNQQKLLPCEAEALSISVALKHFSYAIIQSTKKTRVLTDSRPCVMSFKKLQRGQFSSGPKVSTFLAAASRYGVEILHISGSSNIFSDFASRNPISCDSPDCAICQFIDETCNSAVGEITVSDVLSGKSKVPFATKSSWLKVQQGCPQLTEVRRYITTGANVPKKKIKFPDVKRYINCGVTALTGNLEGLLVTKHATPFRPDSTRVVIPREVSDGLLTALHISLDHPSTNQLKLVFSREFFALDMDAIAKKVTERCFTCASLKHIPSAFHQQSTSTPGDVIGCKFSADVVRRSSQFILIAREDITSYTNGTIITDEKADTLRDGLLLLMSRFRSQVSPNAVIRTDPATALRSLVNDKALSMVNLTIELGEAKFTNKNAIAESAARELHAELIRLQPLGGKISETILAQAISRMNSKIRHSKLSAHEAWTKRDMMSGAQLDVNDKELIKLKYEQRLSNHESSAKSKAGGKSKTPFPSISTGQLVFIYSDSSKLKSRDKYLITAFDDESAWVQKLTNSQFRNKTYKVKRSDLIIIPADEHHEQGAETCKLAPHVESADSNVSLEHDGVIVNKPVMKKPARSSYIQDEYCVTYKNQPVADTRLSDDSMDDTDDEFRPDSVLRFFLPNNTGELIEPQQNNEVMDGADGVAAPIEVNRRPVRDIRPPQRYGDYVTDISRYLQNDETVILDSDDSVSGNDSDDERSSHEDDDDSTLKDDDHPPRRPGPVTRNLDTATDK